MNTNRQVADAFATRADRDVQNRSMRYDAANRTLYSYDTPIAYWAGPEGAEHPHAVLSSQEFYSDRIKRNGERKSSVTTTEHRSHLMSALHEQGYNGYAWWAGNPDHAGGIQVDVTTFTREGGQSSGVAPGVVWTRTR